jgi:NADPH:quinone reductase-like Zn-dependent oxidoreductase
MTTLRATKLDRPWRGIMKAIVCTKWGRPDVLQLREVEKPIPKENEVLVKVHAATVTAGDCELRRLDFPFWFKILARIGFGFRGPRKKILGQEVAGEIVSVGKDVKQFRKGDQVFAHCGFGMGAYAEYCRLPEKGSMAIMPTNMTYEEAAAVPLGGLESLHYLRQADIQSGQKVLINGAGGSIGTIAVQFSISLGAEVACVDSTRKLDMLRSIGADRVFDYTQEDFTKSGETYDVIFDVVGKVSFSGGIRSIKKGGIYLTSNPVLLGSDKRRWRSNKKVKAVIGGNVSQESEDLVFLKGLIEAGKIKAVIDKRYPLEQTAEAHRYVEAGGKKGNVIITVDNDSEGN